MIPNELNHTVEPYTWPNRAHRAYRQKFVYLNGACCLLHLSHGELQTSLLRNIRRVEKEAGPGGRYALGIITNATTNQLSGLHMARAEAWRIAIGMPHFLDLVQRQTIIGAHRITVDYLFDLLIELLHNAQLALDPEVEAHVRTRRTSPKKLAQIFQADVGLPVTPDSATEKDLHRLSLIRNILEHYDGFVNSEYAAVTGTTSPSVGEPLPITAKVASDALDTVDYVVNTLNRGVGAKYPKVLTAASAILIQGRGIALEVDAAHSYFDAGLEYIPFEFPPCDTVVIDATHYKYPLLPGMPNARPNEVQLIAAENVYATNLSPKTRQATLDSTSLNTVRGEGVFSGFYPGASYTIAIGHNDGSRDGHARLVPRWASDLYVSY